MRLLKRVIKRLTAPLRRVAYARLDAIVFDACNRSVLAQPSIAFEPALAAARRALAEYQPPTPWVDEVNQVLDSLIAEQFRLQSQVEELEQAVRLALSVPELAADDGR